MKPYKIVVLIILITLTALGFFTGAVFIENTVKDKYDSKKIVSYESEADYLLNAPRYGYYINWGVENMEAYERWFSTNVFYRGNNPVRTETNISYKLNKELNSFSDISIEIMTNPTKSLLYDITKMSFTNGAKARAESYKTIKTEVENKKIYGISFLDGHDEEYEYGFLIESVFSDDCKVKIQLLTPININNFDESSLYMDCIDMVSRLLNAIEAPLRHWLDL